MKKEDVVAGLILFVFSVVMYLQTYKFPVTPVQSTGPAFWPRILLILLMVLSIALIINAFRSKIINAVTNYELEEKVKKRKMILKPALGMAVCLLFLLIFKRVGFIISTTLFFIGISSVVQHEWNKKNILIMIAQSLILVFLVYFVFGVFLKVNLPRGIF